LRERNEVHIVGGRLKERKRFSEEDYIGEEKKGLDILDFWMFFLEQIFSSSIDKSNTYI